MRAVVVAHGDLGGDPEWAAALLDSADLIVAADGGGAAVWDLGRCPHAVVGDLDSLDAPLRAALKGRGCAFETHRRDKDQTDTELALGLACARGATSIVLLGALGGPRLDHALANVLLLALPELAGRDVCLADPRHEVYLLRAPASRTLSGTPGDVVTLLPLTPLARGITTEGLLYALEAGSLALGRGRGVSNELTGRQATIRLDDGLLLVVLHHRAPAVLGGGPTPRSGRPRGGASRRSG